MGSHGSLTGQQIPGSLGNLAAQLLGAQSLGRNVSPGGCVSSVLLFSIPKHFLDIFKLSESDSGASDKKRCDVSEDIPKARPIRLFSCFIDLLIPTIPPSALKWSADSRRGRC